MMTIFIITHFFDFFLKTISDRTHKYTQTQIQKYKYDPEDILASATSSQGYDCSGPTQTGPTSSTDSQNIGRGPADYTIGSEIRKYVYTQIRIHEMYLCIDANTVRPLRTRIFTRPSLASETSYSGSTLSIHVKSDLLSLVDLKRS